MRAVALLLIVFLLSIFQASNAADNLSVSVNLATVVTKIDDRLLLLTTSSFLLWAADYQNKSFTGAFLYPHLLNKSETAVLSTGSWYQHETGQIWRWDKAVWWTSNYQWHLFKDGDFPYDRYSWYAIIGFTEPIGQRSIHSEFATEIMSLWNVTPLTLSNITASREDQLTKVGFDLKPYRGLRNERRIDYWYLLQMVFSRTNEQITSATNEQKSQAAKDLRDNVLATVTVVGVIFAGVGLYMQLFRKPRWRKYSCRALPSERIFRGNEYGYDPKTFLIGVGSLDQNFETLRDWHAGKTKPLLIRGSTGIGKSRLVSEFLGQLSLRERLRVKILMPTVDDVRERIPPHLLKDCILFLNDLHEFKGAIDDYKLIQLLLDKRMKIVATIPDETYDSNWSVLQSHHWEEMKVEQWTEQQGRRLAEVRNIEFDAASFTGTPLSVIAPAAEIRRQFELLPHDRKAVLEALKVIKTHLSCFATYELASALTVPSGRFDQYAFTDIVAIQKLWCKRDGSTAILADGMDNFVNYDVSTGDAYGLQVVLMRDETPIKGREEYLFYLGNRFSQLGDYERSLECCDRSKDLNEVNPSPWFNRARVLIHLHRIEDAIGSYRQAKELFERQSNQTGIGATLFELGAIEQGRGHYDNAVKLYNESLKVWRTVNYKMGIAIVLHHLGMIEQLKPHPNYPEARKLYNQSLEIKRELGDRSVMAVTLFNLATMEDNEWHLDAAKRLYDESLGILKESGDLVGIANTLFKLCLIEYKQGNYDQARKLNDQRQEIKRQLERRSTHPHETA